MFTKILLAADGSDHAMRAAAYVRDLLKLNPAAKATMLYVEHVAREYHVYRTHEVEVPVDLEAIARDAEKNVLSKTRSVFTSAGLEVESKAVPGSGPETICETADKGGFDLIVMGSRGLNPITGLLMGSVSDRVLRTAKCPVLIVK